MENSITVHYETTGPPIYYEPTCKKNCKIVIYVDYEQQIFLQEVGEFFNCFVLIFRLIIIARTTVFVLLEQCWI